MLTITLEDAKTHLAAAVEERGKDFVYQSRDTGSFVSKCLYQYHGKADCGVGEVFARSGVNMEVNFPQGSLDNSCSVSFLELQGLPEPFAIEPNALAFLSDFQTYQDRGTAWGEAQEFALNRLA